MYATTTHDSYKKKDCFLHLMGFVVIVVFLCLLHSSYYIRPVKSIDAHGNILTKIKEHAPLVKRHHFELSRRYKFPSRESQDNTVTRLAVWKTQSGKYYGLRAKIGVWAHPNQEHSQESGASISVINTKPGSMFNIVEAGVHVFPDLYNNSDVRFFTYWTRDGYRSTGCYNLQCSGFIPAKGAALVPGQAIGPPSTYDGEDHYITISLYTEPHTGNWLLYRDDLERPSFLGHFPKDLCPELNGVAPIVLFSGFAIYPKNGRGPAMGSGHFPKEGDRKAAYFKNMKIFDSNAIAHDPSPSIMIPWMNRPDCYKVGDIPLGVKDSYLFYYGGPEGCRG
uniref:Neprosin PEP catalytic domain-containing protein n=2 Tax=Hordeum vulgare subsp. vulgare TaxID=112509 RepID=A0A8I7BER0_HORVV